MPAGCRVFLFLVALGVFPVSGLAYVGFKSEANLPADTVKCLGSGWKVLNDWYADGSGPRKALEAVDGLTDGWKEYRLTGLLVGLAPADVFLNIRLTGGKLQVESPSYKAQLKDDASVYADVLLERLNEAFSPSEDQARKLDAAIRNGLRFIDSRLSDESLPLGCVRPEDSFSDY